MERQSRSPIEAMGRFDLLREIHIRGWNWRQAISSTCHEDIGMRRLPQKRFPFTSLSRLKW